MMILPTNEELLRLRVANVSADEERLDREWRRIGDRERIAFYAGARSRDGEVQYLREQRDALALGLAGIDVNAAARPQAPLVIRMLTAQPSRGDAIFQELLQRLAREILR